MPITPMMRQYLDIKEENKDAILFFRLGDFYEMFFEDAQTASRELELTLTGKDCGLSERAPMCGVPYHSVDSYIGKLIAKGYRVAICEQMTDPSESKGLVERAITRIISPGTIIEEAMLDDKEPNYILSLALSKDKAGLAFCDVSTGEFSAYQIDRAQNRLADEVARLAPREILPNDPDRYHAFSVSFQAPMSTVAGEAFEYANASKFLSEHFGVKSAELPIADEKLAISAAGALLTYLSLTQKNALSHILSVNRYETDRYMSIDRTANVNLELTESLRTRKREGSLLHTIDRTVTAMGCRMLRELIERPLMKVQEIRARQDAIERFVKDPMNLSEMRELLKKVYDVERLLSKIAYDTVGARDCLALLTTLKAVPDIKRILTKCDEALLTAIDRMIDPLTDISLLIGEAISPDAPISVREGGIIRDGYNTELDKLRDAANNGKGWIMDLERQERETTGIKNLKIGFNRVFGYYIEVTKSAYDLVPFRYVRKQTLANCERFITEELNNIEKTVLGAEENATRLEFEIFSSIRVRLKGELQRIKSTAQGLKMLDATLSLAQLALEEGYIRPELNESGDYEILEGRHPVVAQSIGREQFVPNDTHLSDTERVMIITGPNMAGKSTYMRQVALIIILAHVGSFVPAKTANIAITDRIFTRIGASDDLYGGQSTFMVEMTELANILQWATDRSLLILDEIGRGTSTFDGLSIAWATVEHIASPKCGARTLFATHYHELSELEGHLEGVVDYRITAREQGNDVIFLRKVVRGSADRSYGVAVASLAGLPKALIARARQIMARLETGGQASIGQSILDDKKNPGDRQIGLNDYQPMELIEEIRAIDVLSLSPIDALNLLYTLNEKARKI